VHPDFTVNAGGFCTVIYDLDGVRRDAKLADVRAALRLADQLDEIAFTGLPVSAQEIPESLRPVAMAAELVKHTRKFGGIEAFRASDVRSTRFCRSPGRLTCLPANSSLKSYSLPHEHLAEMGMTGLPKWSWARPTRGRQKNTALGTPRQDPRPSCYTNESAPASVSPSSAE